jgi:GR25 family glycosyltransferase involved in LPS biosynthesis
MARTRGARYPQTMNLHVINLDRSTDRWSAFVHNNGFLTGMRRFPGIDGSRFDRQDLLRRGTLHAGVAYTAGAIGCALSHLALWDMAIESGETSTICEDDALFNRYFDEMAPAVIAALPANWDFILWGWNFDSILLFDLLPRVSPCLGHFDQQAMRNGSADFQQQRVEPRAFGLKRAFGLPCYSVSAAGAAKLKAGCLPIRPLAVAVPGLPHGVNNYGIDVMTNALYSQIHAFVSVPPLVISPNDHAVSLVQTA